MDSLKTLMEKNQYDLVIKLTENSEDSMSLFYRLTALVAVGQVDAALNLILTKRDILKSQLNLLVKFHIETLCLKGLFDEAYQALKYYENLPYESQEVEEILRAMPAYIRNAEKESFRSKNIDEDELNKRLMSDNDEEVLGTLDQIKSLSINSFLPNIIKLISSHHNQFIRTFALLLLVHSNYNDKVEFLHIDKIMTVNPSLLPEPFFVPGFKDLNAITNAFMKEYRDPTITQNAIQELSSYLLFIYPDAYPLKKNETIVVFGYIAKQLLQIDSDDLQEVCEQKNLDYPKVLEQIKEIQDILKQF